MPFYQNSLETGELRFPINFRERFLDFGCKDPALSKSQAGFWALRFIIVLFQVRLTLVISPSSFHAFGSEENRRKYICASSSTWFFVKSFLEIAWSFKDEDRHLIAGAVKQNERYLGYLLSLSANALLRASLSQALTFSLSAVLWCSLAGQSAKADTLIYGGTVLTMADEQAAPFIGYVQIEDNKISAIGPMTEVPTHAQRKIDASGTVSYTHLTLPTRTVV